MFLNWIGMFKFNDNVLTWKYINLVFYMGNLVIIVPINFHSKFKGKFNGFKK